MTHSHSKTRGVSGPIRTAVLATLMGTLPLAAWAGGTVDSSLEAFLAADFETEPSDEITNPWWTLTAGENFLYFAESDGECEWNLVEVLEMSTDNFGGDYAGTDARVVLDREWVDEECEFDDFADVVAEGEVGEVTYDWYAQDLARNIWYMGEHTIDDEGSDEGSFTAGCDGAEAGIVILGSPAKGDAYQQEYYEDEAEDWGKVLNFILVDGLTCMKTKEWTPLEPGHVEHKFYCSDGVTGELVMIEELKGKTKFVDLIGRNVDAPAAPAGPPNPVPADCED
jgi:hypothetical protein